MTDTNRSENEVNIPQLRRLYHWLTYNFFTIFMYGGGYIFMFVLWIAIGLAVVFAPYVVFVLYKHRKYGWLIFFALFVGLPTGGLFFSTGNMVNDYLLHYLPLATFYLFCVFLRYTVADWISDNSPIGEMEVEAEDKANKVDESVGRWISNQF